MLSSSTPSSRRVRRIVAQASRRTLRCTSLDVDQLTEQFGYG